MELDPVPLPGPEPVLHKVLEPEPVPLPGQVPGGVLCTGGGPHTPGWCGPARGLCHRPAGLGQRHRRIWDPSVAELDSRPPGTAPQDQLPGALRPWPRATHRGG